VSAPKLLFEMRASTITTRSSYAPSADGQRFLVNIETTSSPITVVLNWPTALER